MSINQFVERLYLTALDRHYEATGRDYWVGQLNQGMSGSDVARGFVHSPEFIGFGKNNDEFVDSLYLAICDRLPSDEERANWTTALAAGTSRDQVINEFLASAEWARLCAYYSVNV